MDKPAATLYWRHKGKVEVLATFAYTDIAESCAYHLCEVGNRTIDVVHTQEDQPIRRYTIVPTTVDAVLVSHHPRSQRLLVDQSGNDLA